MNKMKVGVQRCSSRGRYPRIHVILVFFLISFIIVSMNCSIALGDDDDDDDENNQRQIEAIESKMPIIDAAKSLFSLPISSRYWIIHKVKTLFQHDRPYFSPPNLDFRGGSGGGDEGIITGDEGATEKVKEAVVKSFDKSKATVEDSAKSAAKFAEETVDKTVKRLKKTLSGKWKEEVADRLVEL